jgi:hypothetical protein
MCRRITCAVCGKPSFAGCGQHVESVLKDVPPSERCRCRATEAAADTAEKPKAGGLRRLFGRSGD